jgi:hypothetical protein
MAVNTKVILEGKGPAQLRDSNYVASGGEGKIYKVSDLVVKIYHEPLLARQRGMPDKIRLLSAIKHPYISSPIGLVTTPTGDPIGHYLNYVDGHPLARVFTNDFWQHEGFTDKNASTLVDRMREVFSFAHQHKAVLVDANELNWFTVFSSGKDPEPRVIDVDSWAIGRWPATVIMPSIRDWHSNDFNQKSDWFAWGIVTFQVYTGLHPYKGTLDGYDRGNLEARMKANSSVFSKGIRLNRAVRDFSKIPGPLLSWYEATFQNGERVNPPSPFAQANTGPKVLIMRTVTTGGSGTLVFDKLLGFTGDPAVRTFHCGAVLLSSGKLVDIATKRQIGGIRSRNVEVIKVDGGWLIGELQNREAIFEYVEDGSLKSESLALKLSGHRLVSYENRMFVVTDSGLTEIKLHRFGKAVASAGQTWGVMVNSTKWFNGVGVMDAMGAKFVVAPFGDDSVAQQRVKEIDGVRIVSAKSGNRFVSLIGLDKTGTYRKFDIVFDRDYKSYSISKTDADGPELNLAILPKGVCATIPRDGELEIFVPSNGQVKPVSDKNIATDMILSNWGDRVIYIQDGEVWSLRLK